MPGHVGAAGGLSSTCGREHRAAPQVISGTLLGTAGSGREGLARRVLDRGALRRGAPGRPALAARRECRPGPGRSVRRVPALLRSPGPAGGVAGVRPLRLGPRVTAALVPPWPKFSLPRRRAGGADPQGSRAAGADRTGPSGLGAHGWGGGDLSFLRLPQIRAIIRTRVYGSWGGGASRAL